MPGTDGVSYANYGGMDLVGSTLYGVKVGGHSFPIFFYSKKQRSFLLFTSRRAQGQSGTAISALLRPPILREPVLTSPRGLFGQVYTVSYSPGLAGASTPGASRDLALTGLLVIPNRKSSTMHVAVQLPST